MRRVPAFVTVLAAVGFSVALMAPAVMASAPTKSEFTFPSTDPLTGVCPFEVTVDSIVNLTLLDFVDSTGAITRENGHVVEQNTFSANGKSLTGLPHTFELVATLDSSGAFTHF